MARKLRLQNRSDILKTVQYFRNEKPYQWPRYWYPRETAIDIKEGFLYLPEGRYAAYQTSAAKSLTALHKHNCLILLGEPGIGKTYTLKNYPIAEGAQLLHVDLGELSTKEEVSQQIFQDHRFRSWSEGRHDLHLLLDSFDECHLSLGTLGHVLVNEFRKALGFANVSEAEYRAFKKAHPEPYADLEPFTQMVDQARWRIDLEALQKDESVSSEVHTWLYDKMPLSRLHLRIACRTADFPPTFYERLKELFGSVEIFVLAPLRRNDVYIAAEQHNIDAEAFLDEVQRSGFGPLASVPVTLNLLLSEFRTSGTLEVQGEHPFVSGGRRLCQELNQSRLDTYRSSLVSPERCFMVAARIAALLTFSNKDTVFTGDVIEAMEDELLLQDICGHSEQAHQESFTVDEAIAKETLRRGLFADRGRSRRGFLHRQFREYLAAWYLSERQLPVKQMLNLLEHPVDGEIVPQLAETAAALASLVPGVYSHFLAKDPTILVRGNLSNLEEQERASLVEALIRKFESSGPPTADDSLYGQLWKVRHKDLATQLVQLLDPLQYRDKDYKRFALRFAWYVKLEELSERTATIALDPHEAEDVRYLAAMAAAQLGSAQIRRSLQTLLEENDPLDEFKGIVLKALWPEHLSAAQLFTHLTPPKRSSLLGSYKIFLGNFSTDPSEPAGFVEFLKPEDLPTALDWLAENERTNYTDDDFREAGDGIMLKAWRAFDRSEIAERFARHALRRLNGHLRIVGNAQNNFENAFTENLRLEPEKRLQLVKLLISERDRNFRTSLLITYHPPLIERHKRDVMWLLEHLKQTLDPVERSTILTLLPYLLDENNPSVRDLILFAAHQDQELTDALGLRPINLDSEVAKQARKHLEQREAYSQQRAVQEKSDISVSNPLSKMREALDDFEAGRIAAWSDVLFYMSMKPGGNAYTREFNLYVDTHPGWQRADKKLKTRILGAARNYLSSFSAAQEAHASWIHPLDFPGYRALRLLFSADAATANTLPGSVYQAWIPSILNADGPSTSSLVKEIDLICKIYAKFPQQLLEAACGLLQTQGADGNSFSVFNKLEGCWDERATQAFEPLLAAKSLAAETRFVVLSELLKHDSEVARQFASAHLRQPLNEEDDKVFSARAVAVALYVSAPDRGWSLLWPLIQADDTSGTAWLDELIDRYPHHWYSPIKLEENSLADLYIWVSQRYPHAEDQHHEGIYTPNHRDRLTSFRDSLLRELEVRGTRGAVAALERVMQTFPDLDWMPQAVQAGAEAMRRRSPWWHQAKDFLELVAIAEKRFVRSVDELADVVLESLERLEMRLQRQETPLASYLWNEWRGEKGADGKKELRFKPKDEESFSDWVRVHLHDDLAGRGIIIGREVKISKGERTDIHVSTFKTQHNSKQRELLKVIVEVKGSWHPELDTAMQTQLLERYLHGASCARGIYLVGWFHCEKWKGSKLKSKDIYAWRDRMAEQAQALSTEGYRVDSVVIDATYR